MGRIPLLFCSHVVDWGGAERVLADLLQTIDRTRFEAHLACPGPGPLPDHAWELGVTIHQVPIGGTSPLRKALGLPKAARALRTLAARLGARVVVATSMIAGYAGVLAQGRDLRCVWHLHIVTKSLLARSVLRRAAVVVTPSRTGAMAVDPRLVDSERLVVLPNGVANRFFTAVAIDWRTIAPIPARSPVVGIVGRIDPDKGHEVLLRAFAAIVNPTPAPHLVVAGGEAFSASRPGVRGLTDRLSAMARELGIADRVHFLGHRDDTAPLLAGLDVVVAPSTAPESAPRTIAEAQAAGRAVVASAIGGVPEMVAPGHTGLLVPPGDVRALRAALQTLLDDCAQREKLGHAARQHATAEYRLDVFARRFEAICANLSARAGD